MDIEIIETELKISLPKHYIDFILSFKGFQDSSFGLENFIYTEAGQLIQINNHLGFYGSDKFIKKKLAIGDNGGGDFYLIDLENSKNEKVYFLDHEESAENYFDKETGTWDWEALESFENFESYKRDLEEVFGL